MFEFVSVSIPIALFGVYFCSLYSLLLLPFVFLYILFLIPKPFLFSQFSSLLSNFKYFQELLQGSGGLLEDLELIPQKRQRDEH